MLELVKPKPEEMIFRQELLADEATMEYNARWGGAVDFSPDRWEEWHRRWVACPEKRFYRYLYSPELQCFVGEIAYHFDEEYGCYLCDVIVKAGLRGRGFGKAGLLLLLEEARRQGIDVICDSIAADNGAIALFRQCGFAEKWRNEEIVMLEKRLEGADSGSGE